MVSPRPVCPQWREVNLPGLGGCALGKYGGLPSHGTCARCLGVASGASQPLQPITRLLSAAQLRRVDVRKRVCEQCAYHKRFTQLTVHCQRCGCAGLSLSAGRCPMGLWPGEGDTA